MLGTEISICSKMDHDTGRALLSYLVPLVQGYEARDMAVLPAPCCPPTLVFLQLPLTSQKTFISEVFLTRHCKAHAHWLGKCPFCIYSIPSQSLSCSPSPSPTVNFKSFHPWGLETKYLALLSQPAHLPVWLFSSLFGWSSSWLVANGQMSTIA